MEDLRACRVLGKVVGYGALSFYTLATRARQTRSLCSGDSFELYRVWGCGFKCSFLCSRLRCAALLGAGDLVAQGLLTMAVRI